MDTDPLKIPYRLVTISGRIASGSTTLAKKLAHTLHWKRMEGGDIFWEAVRTKLGLAEKDTGLRPDEEDKAFDEMQKEILAQRNQIVVESKLAGFIAKNTPDVFRILVKCVDINGNDQTNIRIDRLVNREQMTIQEAKEEVLVREHSDVEKWRRLYAPSEKDWTFWDEQYYNFVVNTYEHDPEEALALVLEAVAKEKK